MYCQCKSNLDLNVANDIIQFVLYALETDSLPSFSAKSCMSAYVGIFVKTESYGFTLHPTLETPAAFNPVLCSHLKMR